jgi:hypothetical protein
VLDGDAVYRRSGRGDGREVTVDLDAIRSIRAEDPEAIALPQPSGHGAAATACC